MGELGEIQSDYDEDFDSELFEEEVETVRGKLSLFFTRPAYFGTSQQCAGGYRNVPNKKRTHRR